MAHSSDTKANTVHSRAKRSCLNCKKYFIPKNSLPKYVEGRTTQTWCSRACYVVLYPQVVEEIKEIRCRFCPTMFTPRKRTQVTCGSKECRRAKAIERRRELYREDPKHRERKREVSRRRYRDKPEERERQRKNSKRWVENPDNRRKALEKQRKRREDPENRRKESEYNKERYLKSKEEPDGP